MCDADGAHVGQSDMPVDLVQSLLDPDKIIAGKLVTTHSGGVLLKDEVMGSRLTNNLIMESEKTYNRGVGVGAL